MGEDAVGKEFEDFHTEWKGYHKGKVIHPVTKEEVSKEQLRQHEIGEIVEKEFKALQKAFEEKEPTEESLGKELYKVVKKSYLASQGISDDSGFDKELLDQNVKQYAVRIAQQATGDQSIESYEDVIRHIRLASNPIHGYNREGESSEILNALVQQYAGLAHKSDHEDTKGQSQRRLEYLTSELGKRKYDEHLKGKYGSIFGDSGPQFEKDVTGGQILNIAEEALTTGKIRPKSLRRRYIKAEAPYKTIDVQL